VRSSPCAAFRMPSYRPGQGLSDEAVERLRARKTAANSVADVPAQDSNAQWDRLLGTGATKKLRCGVCTRPLSEDDQLAKRVVCSLCENPEKDEQVAPLRREFVKDLELGLRIFYYCFRHAPVPSKPAPEAEASPKAQPAPKEPAPSRVAASKTDERKLPLLCPGASMREQLNLVPKHQVPISVLSLNLLSPCYVRVDGQPWNAFPHCEDKILDWPARRAKLLEILRRSDADVICLQEVTLEENDTGAKEVEWLLPSWLQLDGYRAVPLGLKAKEWEKQAQRNERVCGLRAPTGVATLYRSSRFEEAAPAKSGSGSGLLVFLRGVEPLPGGGEGVLELAVGNLHLVGDPDKSSEHLKALNSLKKNFGKQDLRIVCGDFNSECEPTAEVGKWFAEEGLQEVPTGSSWAEPGRSLRLDHIFCSGRIQAFACTGDLSEEEVASGLPCASQPSDHSPVGALLGATVKTKCPW